MDQVLNGWLGSIVNIHIGLISCTRMSGYLDFLGTDLFFRIISVLDFLGTDLFFRIISV
jgi:hypothetical protein